MYLHPSCFLTIQRRVINLKMKHDDDREKALETLSNFDKKIKKLEAQLSALKTKRENFYMRTLSGALKVNNIALSDIYSYIDNKNQKETKSE